MIRTKPFIIATGDIVATITGRECGPVPRLDFTTNRKAIASEKRLYKWLMDESLKEAEARGDSFNALQFKCMNPNNFTQADIASCNLYLFALY